MLYHDLERLRRAGVALSLAAALCGCLTWTAGETAILSAAASLVLAAASIGTRILSWHPHWRTLPVTACSALLAGLLGVGDAAPPLNWAAFTLAILLLLISVVTAVVMWLFPVPPRVKLTGPHGVGTTSWNIMVDDGDDLGARLVPIQIWFPLTPLSQAASSRRPTMLWTSGNPAPGEELREFDTLVGRIKSLPVPWLLNHLALAVTNSVWVDPSEAAAAMAMAATAAGRTIAVCSHGKFGWRQIDHQQCEVVASQGNMVVACDHIPDAMVSRPVGRLDESSAADYNWDASTGSDERAFYIRGTNRRCRDVVAALRHLGQVFPPGSVSFDSMVAWGHSYGGATVATLACRDRRFSKVAMLDGWMWPVPDADRRRGTEASLLLLSAHHWSLGHFQVPLRAELVRNAAQGDDYVFLETSHQNFCDTPLMANQAALPRGDFLGTTNAATVRTTTQLLVSTFFLPDGTNGGTISGGPGQDFLGGILDRANCSARRRTEITAGLRLAREMPEGYASDKYGSY